MRLGPKTVIGAAVGSTRRTLDERLEQAPVEEWDRLAAALSPSKRRRKQCEARDDLLRQLSVTLGLTSVRRVAEVLAERIDRYRASAYRFDKGLGRPADPMRGTMYRVLELNGDKTPSRDMIRRALAGLGSGAKTGRKRPK